MISPFISAFFDKPSSEAKLSDDCALVRKLSTYMDMSEQEKLEVESWGVKANRISANTTLIHQGDRIETTCLMISGWGGRYKALRSGERQMVGIMMPGDTCDLQAMLLRSADHTITMLSNAEVALITAKTMRSGIERHPCLALALWWASLVELGIAREWLTNVGQRLSVERVASLLCELWLRGDRVGLTSTGKLEIPLSQAQLGDALGLSLVHINRMLKKLSDRKIIALSRKRVIVTDITAAMALADFDSSYLQLMRRPDL